MTTAKIMDIISRLPGCAGEAADAVSAYTQVKMEDAHKLLKIPQSECPDIWIRLPRHKWPKSWSVSRQQHPENVAIQNYTDMKELLRRHKQRRKFFNDFPYHGIKMKCWLQIHLNKTIFLCLQLTSWVQKYICSSAQDLCLFDTLFECNPNIHGQERMLVLPGQTSSMKIFHVGAVFSVFLDSLISSTYTDKNSLLDRLTKQHSQFQFFPNRVPIELSQKLLFS